MPATLGENDPVNVSAELVGEVDLDGIVLVVANDAARSSFTVSSLGGVMAVDANVRPLGRWKRVAPGRGSHATAPSRGLALLSGRDAVVLVGPAGDVVWSYPHRRWADYEAGCTWFDRTGQPYAVVPGDSSDRCVVVRFDIESGRPLAGVPIRADEPAGISPIHHRDGWVGLSEGEGQDAARAWWVRSTGQRDGVDGLEVLDAGWDDWVLCDVDRSGSKIITVPHGCPGPLVVRSFPDLQAVRAVESPDDEHGWDHTACFAGEMIVSRLYGTHDRIVAVDPAGTVHDLHLGGDDLIPAAADSWLTVTRTSIRRYKLT